MFIFTARKARQIEEKMSKKRTDTYVETVSNPERGPRMMNRVDDGFVIDEFPRAALAASPSAGERDTPVSRMHSVRGEVNIPASVIQTRRLSA